MPPITPTSSVDPTVMADNWSAGLGSETNKQKLLYKYTHPRRLFNADPAAGQAALLAGVQRAVAANKYATSMTKADTNKAAENMENYGINNWATAGTSKKYKYQAVAAALATAITNAKGQVAAMPRGRGQNNKNRMNKWFDVMSGYYGKIKAA